MTPKLQNGDFCFDSRGMLLDAVGDEELLEWASIRLKARKGKFSLDPELGSDLWKVDLHQAQPADIEPLVREALAPMEEVEYTGLEVQADPDSGQMELTVFLRIRGRDTSVRLSSAQSVSA